VAVLENYPEQHNENIFETSSERYFDESFAVLTNTRQYVEGESKGGIAAGK